MLLTSIQVQDDDSKPPGIFSHIFSEQAPNFPPLFQISSISCQQEANCSLSFYDDLILNKTEKNTQCLFLDHDISFRVCEENMSLTFINRQTQKTQTFLTENLQILNKCYEHLKKRCSQQGFQHKYELGKVEGTGKNSQVFQIKRRCDQVTFAAKVQTDSASLRQEVSILAQLIHPNLIYFHQYFIEDDHTAYLILDYENGGNLLDILKKGEHLTEKRKLKIVKDMLNALQFLRIKGIVHRDLKLQNILYSSTDGNYKIADFGLATKANQNYDKIVGTPGYMAPELFDQSQQKVTDILSDIYSMGLIFFQIFTGVQFYKGKTNKEILSNNMKGKSYRWESPGENEMNQYQKELLRRMIRSRKGKRKNSYQILKSNLFNKITKVYGLDYNKSSTTSPTKSHEEEDNELNLILAVKQLLKIRSCSN